MPDHGAAGSLRVLQISHDYAGPFQNICRQFTDALKHAHVTTLYLRGREDPSVVEATGGDRVLFFEAGNADDLSRQRKTIERLDNDSRKGLTNLATTRLLEHYTIAAFTKKLRALPALKEYEDSM